MKEKEITQIDKKRVCKYWLEIESCRQCLFDALCQFQKNNEMLQSE